MPEMKFQDSFMVGRCGKVLLDWSRELYVNSSLRGIIDACIVRSNEGISAFHRIFPKLKISLK